MAGPENGKAWLLGQGGVWPRVLCEQLGLALRIPEGHTASESTRACLRTALKGQGHAPRAGHTPVLVSGEGPKAHIRKLAECIRWSYGAGIVLRLGNIARLELNYCVPMGVQKGDRWVPALLHALRAHTAAPGGFVLFRTR